MDNVSTVVIPGHESKMFGKVLHKSGFGYTDTHPGRLDRSSPRDESRRKPNLTQLLAHKERKPVISFIFIFFISLYLFSYKIINIEFPREIK